jgi:hypothetical protein
VKLFATPLAINVKAPPGISVVLGRKKQPGLPVHVLSLINRYGGMILRPGDSSHPQIGPIDIEIPVSELGAMPQRVDHIDADGMDWRVDGGSLKLKINRIGHHAVLRIS